MAQFDLVLPITPQPPKQAPQSSSGQKTADQFAPHLETALTKTDQNPHENTGLSGTDLNNEQDTTEPRTGTDEATTAFNSVVDPMALLSNQASSEVQFPKELPSEPPTELPAVLKEDVPEIPEVQSLRITSPTVQDFAPQQNPGNPAQIVARNNIVGISAHLANLPLDNTGELTSMLSTKHNTNVEQNVIHQNSLRATGEQTLSQQNLPKVAGEQTLSVMAQSSPEGGKNYVSVQQPTTSTQFQQVSEPLAQPAVEMTGRSHFDPSVRTGLQHLQQVIDSGNEKGTVVVQRTDQQPAELQSRVISLEPPLTVPRQIHVAQITPTVVQQSPQLQSLEVHNYQPIVESPKVSTVNNPQQLTNLRQDAEQQYLDVRIQNQNPSTTGDQEQGANKQNGNELTQQSPQTTQSASNQGSGESSGIFSVAGTNTVDQAISLQPASTPKPVVLPSGTMVYEQEIIDQMVSRFRLANRVSDSQINIRLHPAELGEMKVDLTLKEGSIKANVVAQSQFVQEILEKNIGKLKSILENQGFTVEEIKVSSESEFIGDFNLFDQQLSKQNSLTPGSAAKRSVSEDPFNFEELTAEYIADSADGVDLKI